jgi:hypothetical protein
MGKMTKGQKKRLNWSGAVSLNVFTPNSDSLIEPS